MQSNITTIFLGTDRADRLKMISDAIKESPNIVDISDQIIVSLDCFNGSPIPDVLHNYNILTGCHRSQVKNITNALQHCNTEWVLYCEDDTVIDFLPSIKELNEILETKINDRQCGMMSVNCGGSTFHGVKAIIGDLGPECKIIKSTNSYIVILRDEEKRSEYFFCMPAVLIRSELFKQLHQHCVDNHKGTQIEKALSKAWFELNIPFNYYKASIGRTNLLKIAQNEPSKLDTDALFLRFLDPNTGASSSGGSNVY